MRLAERRWGSAAALEEQGLRLAPLASGEALPPGLRLTITPDGGWVDNRAWLLVQPGARSWEGSRALRPLLIDEAVALPGDDERRHAPGWKELEAPLHREREQRRARWESVVEPDPVLVVAADQRSPSDELVGALYTGFQAGEYARYQLAGAAGDQPVGALATRSDGWAGGHCAARAMLVEGTPAGLKMQSNQDTGLLGCATLRDEAELAAALAGIQAGCAATWARVETAMRARGLPPEAWRCVQVLIVADQSAQTPSSLVPWGGLISATPGVALGPIAIGVAPRAGETTSPICANGVPLSALSAQDWDAICDPSTTPEDTYLDWNRAPFDEPTGPQVPEELVEPPREEP